MANTLLNEYGKNHTKWALYGEMGAGKTTLVKSIIKELESDDEGTSPTFTIANQYDSKLGKLYHIDLYRMNTIQDVFNAGILEIIESDQYCFVEWPELLEGYMDENWIKLRIVTIDVGVRKMTIEINN